MTAPSTDGCLPVVERRAVDSYTARAYDLFLQHRDEMAVVEAEHGDDGWGVVAGSIGLHLWQMWIRDGEVEVRRSPSLTAYWADVLERPSLASLDAVVHPKDRDRLWQAMEQAVRTGFSETEVRIRALDGRQRWLRTNTVAESDGDGGLVMRGSIIDITAQRALSPGADGTGAPLPLTSRQLQVLQLTAEGATAAEIAERLHLSRRTVENHVARAMRSLGVRRKRDAVALARERGMLGT